MTCLFWCFNLDFHLGMLVHCLCWWLVFFWVLQLAFSLGLCFGGIICIMINSWGYKLKWTLTPLLTLITIDDIDDIDNIVDKVILLRNKYINKWETYQTTKQKWHKTHCAHARGSDGKIGHISGLVLPNTGGMVADQTSDSQVVRSTLAVWTCT